MVCAAFTPILSLLIISVVTMRTFSSFTQNAKTAVNSLKGTSWSAGMGVASTLDILVPAIMVLKGVWTGPLLLGFDGLGSSWKDTDGHENV